MSRPDPLDVVDSHTAGEPTRMVFGGLPTEIIDSIRAGVPLATMVDKIHRRYDWIRTSLIAEPRGSDVMVGAIVVPRAGEDSSASVIFFNNVGYLGMCGHGLIGVVTTLNWLGEFSAGQHVIDTPVGKVRATLHEDGRVTIENVRSYRFGKSVKVELRDGRSFHGDIAWGGNWFFICEDHGLEISLENVASLMQTSKEIRAALDADQAIAARLNGVIDHIELVTPFGSNMYHNFVLCPGLAYDRSPCGTGTSAKVACLAADGKLRAGESITVMGISGESFDATFREPDPENNAVDDFDGVIPLITGRAYVNSRHSVIYDENDPFRFGILR